MTNESPRQNPLFVYGQGQASKETTKKLPNAMHSSRGTQKRDKDSAEGGGMTGIRNNARVQIEVNRHARENPWTENGETAMVRHD